MYPTINEVSSLKNGEISRGMRGHFEWRDKIDDSSRNFEANMTNFAVSTEPADGLALLGVMISADEVQPGSGPLYMYIYTWAGLQAVQEMVHSGYRFNPYGSIHSCRCLIDARRQSINSYSFDYVGLMVR